MLVMTFISRHECHQDPSLVPVVKPVSIKLPQPEETCIIKQVLLPRVECQQVSLVTCDTCYKCDM